MTHRDTPSTETIGESISAISNIRNEGKVTLLGLEKKPKKLESFLYRRPVSMCYVSCRINEESYIGVAQTLEFSVEES